MASLIAPWVRWGIEKKREKRIVRREIVKRCRELLYLSDNRTFRETQEYRYIKPYLSKKAIEHLEDDTKAWVGTPDPLRQSILEGIEKLEKHWDLD
ncbi:MAG: hypothetical protein ISS49_15920 [Anaerolineae bacterium]|nr:hypothetical protein [Anaerolineae bacterium]